MNSIETTFETIFAMIAFPLLVFFFLFVSFKYSYLIMDSTKAQFNQDFVIEQSESIFNN